MRSDHIYEEVWTSRFTKAARAEDVPEIDKTPLGFGRPSLSLTYMYSQIYRCNMVLRNIYTFTTCDMCYPIIRFSSIFVFAIILLMKNICANYFCALDKVRKICDNEKGQLQYFYLLNTEY